VQWRDPSGLLRPRQCFKIGQLLEYEVKHGTTETASRFSNTFQSSESIKLGQEFDDQAITTIFGPVDLDWYTDVLAIGRGVSYDTPYVTGKILWKFIRWIRHEPGAWPYQDKKEKRALELLNSGFRSYHDLFPEEFLARECPCSRK
jgi:hypothetical protein